MSKFWSPLLYPWTPKCVINQRYFVIKMIKNIYFQNLVTASIPPDTKMCHKPNQHKQTLFRF